MAIFPGSEFAYIDWLRSRIPAHPRVLVGPGDDAAAILVESAFPLLITTDMLLEGSCFRLDEAGPHRVGRKAMAVNLSDIAAMAGRPTAAVVSVGLPRNNGRKMAELLFGGLKEMADAFATPIVGGDTNSWDGPLVISVTIIGESVGKGPVRRNGAKPGDWIMVTGPLGGSILQKHLDFTPRVNESIRLLQAADIHSMIDISDGLAADLHHICEESGCGACLRAKTIPITPAAFQLATSSGRTALDHALSDGEDFELVFTVCPDDGRRLLLEQPVPGIQLVHVGEIIPAGYWLEESGVRRELSPKGFVHEIR